MKTTQSNILNSINLIPLGLVSLSLLSGAILVSSSVSADDPSVVDEINITVPVSCTMSGTGMQSHNANINNGLYEDDIGSTVLHAFCNDNEGFAIYAAGYTGNEVGGTNSNKLVGTTASGNATIESGTATTAGNPDVSNWAMKLAITQDSGDTTGTNAFTIDSAPNVSLPSQAESGATQAPFSNYHVVPNEYVKVAHKNSGTDMTDTTGGVKLTTTYAAYISKTQPADTYSGQVIYTLVHPSSATPSVSNCEPGYICYDANADANEIEGAMGNQTLQARDWSSCVNGTDNATYCYDADNNQVDPSTLPYLDGVYLENIALQASNFKRDGYGFAGWNDKADMSGTNYGPNQTIPVTQDMIDNGLTLYAHWVESTGNLQGWNGCSALNTNQVIALTDTRDNNVYAVAKLADNNCWMIENLRLADTDSTSTTITLNSTNTNSPASGFVALAATSNDWCKQYNESCINQNKLNTTNTISFTGNTTSTQSSDIYSYGNYYNWYSATAGNGTYSQTSGNAAGDICPSGWALPTGNIGGQFEALNTAINSSATNTSAGLRTYPANFIYSGSWGGSSAGDRGDYGYYWSRTANSNNRAYVLHLYSSDVSPGTSFVNKYYGFSARCVAQ